MSSNWNTFVKNHSGEGLDMSQMSQLYRAECGYRRSTSPRKSYRKSSPRKSPRKSYRSASRNSFGVRTPSFGGTLPSAQFDLDTGGYIGGVTRGVGYLGPSLGMVDGSSMSSWMDGGAARRRIRRRRMNGGNSRWY